MALGFSRGEVDGRVRRGEWVSVDYAVYCAAGTPASWQQRLMAACLGGLAVASHRSAARLWALPVTGIEIVEVTALRHRRRYPSDVVWHESICLDDRDVTLVQNIPVTLPARTIVDLGLILREHEIAVCIDDAVRRRLTSLAQISRQLDGLGARRRGIGVVRDALRSRTSAPIPESVLEAEFERLVAEFDLPIPSRQWKVRDAAGRIIARVDYAYPVARVAIEIDGAAFHQRADRWSRDLERQNAVMAEHWRMLRFTADDIRKHAERVNQRIRQALSL